MSYSPGCLSPPRSDRSLRRPHHGFTLIELLVVVAVIAIVVSVSSISLSRTLQAMSLTNAGNKVTQLIESARQRAMSANVLTAVIVITQVPGDVIDNASGRAFTVVERATGGSWKQIREWELLPAGIILDLGAGADEATFMTNSPSVLPGQGGLPAYLDHTTYAFAARVFLPSGGLMNSDQPARFQLVDGMMLGGGVNYANKNSNGGPANYYRISVLGATGKTKVDRP